VDVGLPILDGYKVAQCIRTVLGRKIFLVAHTGYGQPEDRRRAFEAGFDAHLVKPVDWLELNSWLSDLSNPRG
jgi:CheY-like chemotaxis protein